MGTAPGDAILRFVVGTLRVVAVLVGCALTPTALNRSARIADGLLPLAPVTTQRQGLLVVQSHDYFDGEPSEVVTVARVGASAPTAYDGIAIPRPSEITASPRLVRDRDAHPTLEQRYPGDVVGTVPDRHLLGPHSRVVWRGATAEEMPPNSGWLVPSRGPRNDDVRSNVPDVLGYAYPVLVLGFVLPLTALVAVLAALGATRREQRLASLRLVGLSDRAAKWSAAIEEAVVSMTSVLVGTAVFMTAVPVVSGSLPAEGAVWSTDVELAWPSTVALLLCLPGLSILLSLLGLRRLKTSPPGVERRSAPRPPSRWPFVPLALGVALLGASVSPWLATDTTGGAVLLVATALVSCGLAGSLPTMVGWLGRLLRRGPLSALVAARKIESEPAKVSRVATGLTMLVIASGLMLIFFPLISESDSGDYRAAADTFGSETLFGFQAAVTDPNEMAARSREWSTVRESPSVRGSLLVRQLLVAPVQRPDEVVSVLVVNCDELADFASVRAEDCARGLAAAPGVVTAERSRAVRETDSPDVMMMEPVGPAFRLPSKPAISGVLELVDGVANSGAQLIIGEGVLPAGVPLDGAQATLFVQPESGSMEQVRTSLLVGAGVSALTFEEHYRISTLSTRQFQVVMWVAAMLVIIIAGLATLLAAYEQVRSTRPERRLLAVGGAPRSLSAVCLTLQTILPVGVGVVLGGLATLAITRGFVRLLVDQGGAVSVPVAGIATTAAVALAVPVLATLLALRLEPAKELLRRIE